jgi:hypothetical protein
MQAIKTITLVVSVMLAPCLRGQPLPATEPSTNFVPTALNLQAKVELEAGPGFLPANRAYLTAGTNRFAFLVPSGFALRVLGGQRLHLFTGDYRCLLAVQFLESASLDTKGLASETSLSRIVERFPHATILGETQPTVCGRLGVGYDFEWMDQGELPRRTRVVLVDTSAGIMELSLTCSPDAYGIAQRAFNTLVITLVASDPAGKLEVMPLSSVF